jgi:hypothetical protein
MKKVSELIKGNKIEFEGKEREIVFITEDIDPRWAGFYLVEFKGLKKPKLINGEEKYKVIE